MDSSKGKIIIKDNPLFHNSSPTSYLSNKESHLGVVGEGEKAVRC